MLDLLTTAPSLSAPAWMVQLEAEFTAVTRPAPDPDACEPMVELMSRTGGVGSVAIVPLRRGLAVAVGLSAPNASTAVEQARTLVVSAARYAGLGELAIRLVRVAADPDAGTAWGGALA